MQIRTKFLAIFTIFFLIEQTTFNQAFARAGGRSSGFGGSRSSSSYYNQGSRGNKTYDSGGSSGKSYSTMEKSTTNKTTSNNQNSQNGSQNNNSTNNLNASQPSFFQKHPFLSVFAGALAGSWLGNMIFGGSGLGGGMGNGAMGGGFLSGLIPLILIGLLVWFVIRILRRNQLNRNQIFNNNNLDKQNNYQNSSDAQGYQNFTSNNSYDIEISENDKQKFAELLIEIQSAWSNQDLESLKKSVTPEILKYFSDALHQNQSQDLANKVENIEVLSITISESWQEDDLQYVTSILEWSALDYSINIGKDINDSLYISEGNKQNPIIISEAWTFVRYGTNGKWILSAIAQIH